MRARRRDDTALALAKTWLVKPVLQESRARARHPPAEASAAIPPSTDKKGGSAFTAGIPEKPAGGWHRTWVVPPRGRPCPSRGTRDLLELRWGRKR